MKVIWQFLISIARLGRLGHHRNEKLEDLISENQPLNHLIFSNIRSPSHIKSINPSRRNNFLFSSKTSQPFLHHPKWITCFQTTFNPPSIYKKACTWLSIDAKTVFQGGTLSAIKFIQAFTQLEIVMSGLHRNHTVYFMRLEQTSLSMQTVSSPSKKESQTSSNLILRNIKAISSPSRINSAVNPIKNMRAWAWKLIRPFRQNPPIFRLISLHITENVSHIYTSKQKHYLR